MPQPRQGGNNRKKKLMAQPKRHHLEVQIADLQAERLELLRQLHRLEMENASLRDRLRSEHNRSTSLAAKLGACSETAWTRPSFSDFF